MTDQASQPLFDAVLASFASESAGITAVATQRYAELQSRLTAARAHIAELEARTEKAEEEVRRYEQHLAAPCPGCDWCASANPTGGGAGPSAPPGASAPLCGAIYSRPGTVQHWRCELPKGHDGGHGATAAEGEAWVPRPGDTIRRKYDGTKVKTLQYTPTGYVRYQKPDGSVGSDHIRSLEASPEDPPVTLPTCSECGKPLTANRRDLCLMCEKGFGPGAPAQREAAHSLNEYTYCVACKRFDPSGTCPGAAAPAKPDLPGGLDLLDEAKRALSQSHAVALKFVVDYLLAQRGSPP